MAETTELLWSLLFLTSALGFQQYNHMEDMPDQNGAEQE